MIYYKILAALSLVNSFVFCSSFNIEGSELYSKEYTVEFVCDGSTGPKKLYLVEDPTIDLEKLTVYHEDYEDKIVTQFHVGDKITIYYEDDSQTNIKYCSINKVESVPILFNIKHLENEVYRKEYYILDKNFKYSFSNINFYEGTLYLNGEHTSYFFGRTGYYADGLCFAAYQEEDAVDNTVEVLAIYETPLYLL